MSRPPLGVVILALGVLAARPAAAQETRILEAYRLLDEDPRLDDMKRHKQQVELLSATLDATEKSLELVDQSSLIVERAINCGIPVVPDQTTSLRLQNATVEVRASAERVLDSWPARGVQAALSAREYAGRLEGIDAVLNDPSLPPKTADALAALRTVGEAMRLLGEVPIVGAAVEQYGELTTAFSESLRRNYRILSPGKIDKALLSYSEAELVQGFPAVVPYETEVLLATRWKVPLLCDRTDGSHYLKVGRAWKKVDPERINAIVSDWLIVYGGAERSLYSSTKATLEDLLEGPSAKSHWSDPPPRSFYSLATSPEAEVHGLTRKGLRERAQRRLAELADEREMQKVLGDVPRFQEGRVDLEWYRDRRKTLRDAARWMGVPLSRDRERVLLRELFLDQERVQTALRTTAFSLMPGAEDYVRGLGLDPWGGDFWEVAGALEEYRTDEALVQVRVEVREAGSNRPIPDATVTLVRAITAQGQKSPQTGPLGSRKATTGGDGVAEIEVLRGHHFVSAQAPGFDRQAPGSPVAFMEPSGARTVVTLGQPALFEEIQGTLEAWVLDRETGDPIPGARVTLSRGEQQLAAVSSGDGAARLENVPFGTWTLSVEAEGYEKGSRSGFELRPDAPDRRGRLRLRRVEPEIRLDSLPKGRLEPPAPEPDPKACGFRALAEVSDSVGERVDRSVSSGRQASGLPTRHVNVPGPGRLRIGLVVSGKHENHASDYTWGTRFVSRVLVGADPSVLASGEIEGPRYFGNDSGKTSASFSVQGPGAVSLTFVPERCPLRKGGNDDRCYSVGSSMGTGFKFFPMSYALTVEFDPCGQE